MPNEYGYTVNSFGGTGAGSYVNVTSTTATATATATVPWSTSGSAYGVSGVSYPAQWFIPGESRNPCGEIALGEGGIDRLQEAAQRELKKATEDLAALLKKRYTFFKKKLINEVYIEEEE